MSNPLKYSLCTKMTIPCGPFGLFSYTRKVILASYFTYEDARNYAKHVCMFTDEQMANGAVWIEPNT